MFNLIDYRKQYDSILADENLSDKGREASISKLKKEGKKKARETVKKLREEAVIKALNLRDIQAERLGRTSQAMDSMDYNRLNYEAEALKAGIKAYDSLIDAEEAWEQAKISRDIFKIKAWQDMAPGLLSEKFSGDNVYSGLRDALIKDIKEAEAKVEEAQQTEQELKTLLALRDIQNQAEAINEAFGSGQAVIKRVFSGMAFEGDDITLSFNYQTNKLTDRQETPEEVAWRLEREYKASYEDYDKAMSGRGFERLDMDFDDFDGVLDIQEEE